MPIYEYNCKDCGHRFERIVFRGGETAQCPMCRSHETERAVSTFAMGGGASKSASGAGCGPGKFT